MTSIPDPSADGASKLTRGLQRPVHGSQDYAFAGNLDAILGLLNRYHQRATYGAVAKILGLNAAFLMGRRPRDPLHSWVVNQATQLPTGYSEDQMHPDLFDRAEVVCRANDLDTWLSRPS